MAVNASSGEEENKSLLVAISEKALWKKRKLEPEVEKLVGVGTQKGQEQQDRESEENRAKMGWGRFEEQGGTGVTFRARRQCGKEVFWSGSQFHCKHQDGQT